MRKFLRIHFNVDRADALHTTQSTSYKLQLALRTSDLEQASAIAQDYLAGLVFGNKANLFKSIRRGVAHTPHLSGKLVARSNWRSKASLELLEICGVAPAKFSQNTVRSGIPAEETVNNGAAKAHLLTRFGSRVQGVVVPVQTRSQSISG